MITTSKEQIHGDFGEKIGGARKDSFISQKNGFSDIFFESVSENLAFLNELERQEYVNKANIFKPIDIELMRNNGVEDPASIKYMQAIRSAIGAKPKLKAKHESNAKDYLAVYINFVKFTETVIMEASVKHSSFEDVQAYIDNKLKSYLCKAEDNVRNTRVSLTEEGKMLNSIDAFSTTLFDRMYNKSRDKTDYKNTTWEMLLTKKGGTTGTREESIRDRLKSLEHLDHVIRNGVVRRLGDEDITTDDIHEKFAFRGGEFGNWLSQKERGEVINMAYDALLDLSDVMGAKVADISLNSSLSIAFGSRGKGRASAHYEPMRRVINLTRMSGAGSLAHEWFHALDNWVGSFKFTEDKERAGVLEYENYPSGNMATDMSASLLDNFSDHPDREEDTARILKVREMMSDLGIRLKYKEPDMTVLAHGLRKIELATSRMKRVKSGYKKDYYRNEIEELEKRLGKTDFFTHAGILDDGKKDYFAQTVELGARAFESYVLDELEGGGYRNDYLVASTKKAISLGIEISGKGNKEVFVSAYPQGEEREEFRQEFRQIMDVLFPDGDRMSFKKDLSQDVYEREERRAEREIEMDKEVSKTQIASMRQLHFF